MEEMDKTVQTVDSFVFYRTFRESLKFLSKDDGYEFINAIMDFALDGVEPEFSNNTLKALWVSVKFSIDNAKARRAKAIEAGRKGGKTRAKNANVKAAKTTEKKIAKLAKMAASDDSVVDVQNVTTVPENVSDNVQNVAMVKAACDNSVVDVQTVATVPESVQNVKKHAAYIPTVEEVNSYLEKTGTSEYMNVSEFLDFYKVDSKSGNSSDWKRCADNWVGSNMLKSTFLQGATPTPTAAKRATINPMSSMIKPLSTVMANIANGNTARAEATHYRPITSKMITAATVKPSATIAKMATVANYR